MSMSLRRLSAMGRRSSFGQFAPTHEPLVVAFHKTLSEDSVRMRYMQAMKLDERTAHQRLLRICFIDYDREIALVAEREPAGGMRRRGRSAQPRSSRR